MMADKKLKDPLYGYIAIPENIMHDIVDSASFQRLRRISQTSYAPLYSSAMHNRFVHSLGVYHLGGIASDSLVRELEGKTDSKLKIDRIQEVFLLACLLHDVGHAPFSHTGEDFYLEEEGDYSQLHTQLKDKVADKQFAEDIDAVDRGEIPHAASHEIMSAIVGLKTFPKYFHDKRERSFFARCITGYQYRSLDIKNSIRNCFIQLLNSKTIDVDKLDYLIRDSYITGYDTIRIDYQRLLNAITIITKTKKDGSTFYGLAYSKRAVSVIENVIYAHDSERKWIQSHPVILYENNLLTRIMRNLSDEYTTGESRLFSLEAISPDGVTLTSKKSKNKEKVCLLCDDDIIYLMKRYYPNDQYVREYFDRYQRFHPIWKSEAEYKAYLYGNIGSGIILNRMEDSLLSAAEYLGKGEDCIVNKDLLETLQAEISQLKDREADTYEYSVKEQIKQQIKQDGEKSSIVSASVKKCQEKEVSW